ncbi:protein of unknown function [Butyrivibrio proteoclasticus]|uniref:Prolow-density lipoprotein receptor-related protein 1-like beta-propeller domain-containing protein n=1 Tax=Butyrivibrio proteoclasticus TaxID=43305 RepID=A0A1I5SXZ6_9FIRM|nr:DUF5050 domain-containing protein [Butyrivibrio proteoclasticus]SFP75633.1 protein of unknown function [Butyrivibrio proteoclasticus]
MSKRAIIVVSIIALLTVGTLALYIHGHQIPMSSSDSGNSAGNLHNNGYFFEMDGNVYFSNPYDSNCLYSMNLDETKPKRLTSMGVKYINGANGLLYFYMDSTSVGKGVGGLGNATNQYGIYRCKINGGDQTCLLRDFCGELSLCGEYVYYQVKTDGGSLNKIRVDKKNKTLVSSEMISPVCYDSGIIYYTGVDNDHAIHSMDTQNGDAIKDVLSGHCFFPIVHYGYIYYLNGDSNYSLWRTNLYSGETELITSDRVDCFNLNDQYIYYSYSNTDSPALRRCGLDGSGKVDLYEGVVNSINLTSRFIYFKVYGQDDVMYHMPLDGSAPASLFVLN